MGRGGEKLQPDYFYKRHNQHRLNGKNEPDRYSQRGPRQLKPAELLMSSRLLALVSPCTTKSRSDTFANVTLFSLTSIMCSHHPWNRTKLESFQGSFKSTALKNSSLNEYPSLSPLQHRPCCGWHVSSKHFPHGRPQFSPYQPFVHAVDKHKINK